jgi:hypothetical protein
MTKIAKIALIGNEVDLLKSFLIVSSGLVEPDKSEILKRIFNKIEKAESRAYTEAQKKRQAELL